MEGRTFGTGKRVRKAMEPAPEPEEADETLARRAGAGERAAFAALAARHYDRIHAMAWRWTGERAGAEDVAQETMVRMARSIRDWRGEGAFAGWLRTIAYNAAMDFLRARKRTVALAPEALDALREGSAAQAGRDGFGGDDPEAAMMNGDLWSAVRALPARQRDAVLLVYGEDLTHAEAAEILGVTEKTLSWHVHEARVRLKGVLLAGGGR